MRACGWTQLDVVRISGQSHSLVSQWLGNGSKTMKTISKLEAAQALAQKSGFEALWIARGIGPKKIDRPDAGGPAHDMSLARATLDLPTLTWETLMEADLSQPFELAVIDDALAPEIFRGCVARLDPNRGPVAGRPVLVRDAAGNHYLRDYQQGPGGSWQAVARQRGFAALDSRADDLTIVAVLKGIDWP